MTTGTGARARLGSDRVLVLGGAMLWGTTGTAQALGPAGASPATVGAVRIALGALALIALCLAGRRLGGLHGFVAPRLRLWTLGAVLGIAAYQVCFFAGVARTGVAVGTVVALGGAPVATGAIELALRGTRPERRWALSTALAVGGCALLVGVGRDAQVDPLGVLLAVAAGGAYALYTVTSKTLMEAGHGPVQTMAVTFAAGTVLLAPVLIAGDIAWLGSGRGIAMALWLGVVTVAVGYSLFASGLSRLAAATVATLTLVEPLTAALLAVVVLGERPGAVAVLGAGLVATGLVLLAVRPAASRATAAL